MNGGFTVYYCDTCGFCYESDFTPVSDHNYDVKTVAPTCESDGYTVFFCKDCGITVEGDTVPALGHSYSDYEEAPTCTKSGVIGERCDNCGMTAIYETIPALGHKWELVNSEAPTCVKAGYDVYACPDCGESYKDNLTEATGEHNYSDGFCIWCGRDENYVCEHELTKEVILDLHELGACENTYLIYLTCECGEVKQLFDPESIYLCESMQFEYEMTESDTEISRRSIGHCEFCGLSVIGDTYGYREGCVIYQSLTVRDLMLNGVRISDDISYSISEEYHENVELEIIHLDEEYGACEGGYIEVERCKDCGKATEILDIQLGCEIDTIENTEDEFGGVYSKMESTCEQCGIRFVIEGYELSTECGHLYELHVLINDKDGNEIVDADIVDEERDHDYYYDYVLYGDDCTGLYKVIRLCSYCDYREEYFTFGRHLYRDLEFALGDYGCNGTLDGRFCVICGYTDNYHLDFVCDLIEVDREEYQDDEGNTHTRIVAECTVCGLQYIGDGWAISNDCYEGNAATLEIISGEFHFSFCTDEMREYHDYEYTITYDGVEDCDDGVTVTMVCRNCNKTSSFHTTGHNPCIKEFVRLSEYGCCNHYYVINRCPCGEYEYEEFDTSHCEKCGYEMTGEGDKFNYGCRVEETVITNIVVNGKIVKTFSKTRVYSEHNYTVTNVVVSGGVYYVCTRCENCGAYSEREIITAYVEKQDDGCYYEYVYIPANSGNYIVESVSDDDTYAVLGIYDENGKFIELKSDDDDGFNTNFRIEYYLEADRVYVYRIRYLDHDKEGEILFNITIADSMCDHNSGGSVVDYAVGDSPCKDGIFHITICDECGEAVSVYATYEHNYEYFYIDLTEYGFCGGSASGNVCACGEGNIYVGMGCNQSTIESDRTETVNDNGDTCIVITGFCPTCQMYYIHETLITTENCVRYVTENHFVYKGEELIYEATNTRNYEHHDFVNTHPEIDSCLDGFEITSTCRDCGYSTSIYYDHHAPVYEERVDAADCGMCGDNYVTVTRCACGAPEGITINYNLSGCTIDYRYDYYTDENGYSHTVDIMYCTECGMEAYFDKYRLSEGCTNYTYNIFSFVMNGEVLIDAVEYLYMKSDKHDMIVDGFKLDGETCDYGYTLYYTCKACGIKSESYRIGHSYKYEMIEDLSKYGACGAQLVFNTCPCGLEGTVEFIFGDCETVFDEETLEDVDGNEVHAMYYVCEKCGMRVEIYEVFLMSGSYSTRYDVVISGPDGKQTSMSFYK